MSTPSSQPVADILTRLSGAKQKGKGWTAQCPAHEDKKSSLSVGEGRDGRALLKCFAGCSAEQVVTRLGLTMKDLYPSKPPRRRSLTVTELAADKAIPVEFLK